jgi:hypothetical protein
VLEVPDDLVSAGVVTAGDKPVTNRHDQLDRVVRCLVRRAVRSPRPRLERRVTLGPPASHQLGHPPLRHVVLAGDVNLAATLDDNSGDDKTSFRHPPTSKPASVPTADGVSHVPRHGFLCPERGHRRPHRVMSQDIPLTTQSVCSQSSRGRSGLSTTRSGRITDRAARAADGGTAIGSPWGRCRGGDERLPGTRRGRRGR